MNQAAQPQISHSLPLFCPYSDNPIQPHLNNGKGVDSVTIFLPQVGKESLFHCFPHTSSLWSWESPTPPLNRSHHTRLRRWISQHPSVRSRRLFSPLGDGSTLAQRISIICPSAMPFSSLRSTGVPWAQLLWTEFLRKESLAPPPPPPAHRSLPPPSPRMDVQSLPSTLLTSLYLAQGLCFCPIRLLSINSVLGFKGNVPCG